MYGGLLTIALNCGICFRSAGCQPAFLCGEARSRVCSGCCGERLSSLRNNSNRSLSMNWMRSATLCRAAFRRATSRASREISVANISRAAEVRAPKQSPSSQNLCRCRGFAAGHSCARIRAAQAPPRSRARSQGRGIKTAEVTSKSSPQNSCLPVRYCVGTPLARSAISN